MSTRSAVNGVTHSLSGKSWQWRGGNMDLAGDGSSGQSDLARLMLLARGIEPSDLDRNLNPTLRQFLPDPSIFRDMDIAAARLADAVIAREAVTVYGDYDVDGATSAALLIRLFRALGHDADYYIPDRLLEGYGPSGEALVRLGTQGSGLVITVDCGAMAHEALGMARDAGIDVVVVDHHKCAATLPPALALVNPNRLDETAEAALFGHLAAVGVAFLLAIATVRELRQRGYFQTNAEPDLFALLDVVALGTVADVASLRGLNRAFVAQGLKVMARRESVGMAALIDASRLNRAPTSSDLGFALGPRINAGGRIGEATLGVRLLTTCDPAEARMIAEQLSALNEERRAIESTVQAAAEAQIALQNDRAVLIAAGMDWHPGVIGIVAGRIKEKTGKPAIVIALKADEHGHGKGSGRSIAGVDLGAAIIAAREQGLLMAGGGHAMAAGLTIATDAVPRFIDWLDQHLMREVSQAMRSQDLLLDLSLSPGGLTPDLIGALDELGPFGMGWPGPRIAVGPLQIVKSDIVGTDHLRLIVRDEGGHSFKAIAFRAAHSDMGQALLMHGRSRKVWLAGRAKLDDWSSRPAAELHIEDAAWAN